LLALLLGLFAQQRFHLAADARLDLVLEPRLHLLLGALGLLRLLLRRRFRLGALLGERGRLGFRAHARLRERLRFLLRAHAHFGELALLGLVPFLLRGHRQRCRLRVDLLAQLLFAHLLLELGLGALVGLLLRPHLQLGELAAFLFLFLLCFDEGARRLLGGRLPARFLLVHLRLELGLGALGGFLGALRLLHRLLLGFGLGARLGLELRARFGLELGLRARGLVGLLTRLAVGVLLGLLANQLADVVGGPGHHPLRGRGHLVGGGEVEVVPAALGGRLAEGVGFLLGLEDAREPVLRERHERLLQAGLVDVGLFEQLAKLDLPSISFRTFMRSLESEADRWLTCVIPLAGLGVNRRFVHRFPEWLLALPVTGRSPPARFRRARRELIMA